MLHPANIRASVAIDERSIKKFKRGIMGDERDYIPSSTCQEQDQHMAMNDGNDPVSRPNQWQSGRLKEKWITVVEEGKEKDLPWPNLNVPAEAWQKYAEPYMRALVVKVLGRTGKDQGKESKGNMEKSDLRPHAQQESEAAYGPWMMAPSRQRRQSRASGFWDGAQNQQSRDNMIFTATNRNEQVKARNIQGRQSGKNLNQKNPNSKGGNTAKSKENNGGSRFTVLLDEDEEGVGAIRIQNKGKAKIGSSNGAQYKAKTSMYSKNTEGVTVTLGNKNTNPNVEVDLEQLTPITKGTTYAILNNSISKQSIGSKNPSTQHTQHENRTTIGSDHNPSPHVDLFQAGRLHTSLRKGMVSSPGVDKGQGGSQTEIGVIHNTEDNPHSLASGLHEHITDQGNNSEGWDYSTDIRDCSDAYFNWKTGIAMDPRFFNHNKYEDLVKYTNSFSDENCIGSFQFGKIYRGNIYRGYDLFQPVIVKIWDTSSDVICENELRLMREVTLIRNEKVLCQPAVPKLLGYLCDGKHLGVFYNLKALNTVRNQLCEGLYEMKCSLIFADVLYDFNWARRIKVGLWFARIVEFFHSSRPPFEPFVIHNIDANNILLDEDYVPKLFDFSLMTGGGIFPEEPEDEKTCGRDDVFGFGLLILSLISKQNISKEVALDFIRSEGCNWKSVSSLIGNKKVSLSPIHGIFEADPYFDACDGSQVVELVLDCLKSIPDQRPSMKQVVERLEKLQIAQNHAELLEVKPKPPSRYWF
ncbi:hypothetical protein BUALT_Bualt03G0193900 [Buddleja alternifolia]|uniref:Protein kinase domain-containing protein n=1 Tax=Buddleja alternifolia TaxID=168488 RepID=A0AAV6XZG4_9LAMI|nr:hypothetical protein BUALT_Bualt03G0193900 [Buddleja alternifolia]